MPRRRHHNKPYRVAPGRKADEIDDRIYELHQMMNGVWPPHATYICSRCGRGGPLAEFKMERDFGVPERRQCVECAKSPRPEPKPPTVSVKPKRPNRAAELAAARLRYEEEQERIRQEREDDEYYEHCMRLMEEEEKKYAAEMARAPEPGEPE
ncbi:hypothetical protein [Pelagibacterium sp. H642]|uniref:hypothetical protein n=1 Tax=Pelagibacterium sp. H642 TaxID=1881069 RepID=UPI00281521EC|nr:hypothetical protein [Pelagibacterium sp. H642]WMT90999.1 hypothetical protein NO934_01720 [Pelagibacterium sp. H642]